MNGYIATSKKRPVVSYAVTNVEDKHGSYSICLE